MQRQQRRYRILMVDDDPLTCEAVSRALRTYGHSVRSRTVSLGTLADIRGDMPDVLVLDVSMPSLPGDKLLQLVRQIFPRLRVVIYTGTSKNCLPDDVKIADLVLCKGPPEELAEHLNTLR